MRIVVILICWYLFWLSFFLPAQDKSKNSEENSSSILVKVVFKKDGLDRNLKKQLEYFGSLSELINEYNRDFSESVKLNIAELFRETALVAENELHKKYYLLLADAFLKNNFQSLESEWLNLKDYKLNVILKPGSSQQPKKFDWYVFYEIHEDNAKIEKYLSIFDKMIDNLGIKKGLFPVDRIMIAPIRISEIIFSTDFSRLVLLYPDSPEMNHNLIFFKNLAQIYYQKILEPISSEVIEKSKKNFVDFESYFLHIIMHRVAHYIGPSFFKEDSEEMIFKYEELKDLFHCIEEIKADLIGILNTLVLMEKGLVNSNKEKKTYHTYLIYLIDKIRSSPEQKNPYLVQFNFLLKQGGIDFNLNDQKLIVVPAKLKKVIKELMVKIFKIESEADYDRANKLISSYDSVPGELKVIFQRIEKIPKSIALHSSNKEKEDG